jgi:hypothetical protein
MIRPALSILLSTTMTAAGMNDILAKAQHGRDKREGIPRSRQPSIS